MCFRVIELSTQKKSKKKKKKASKKAKFYIFDNTILE